MTRSKSQVVAVSEGSELIDRDRRTVMPGGARRTGVVKAFNFNRTRATVQWSTGKVTSITLEQPGFSKRFTCK